MKKLVSQRYLIRQNLMAIIGICLCAYFTYHATFGTRSYFGLNGIEHEIEKTSAAYDKARTEREALEDRVARLRPNNLDRDMLEERARVVLGYSYPEEKIIIRN